MPASAPPALQNPTCHQTASGLTVIAEQMPIEAVNFSLWIPIGSAVETDDINGMAHFLEHMVFKGTQALAPGAFERQVEACGGATNAMTSQDYTCFYINTAPQDFKAIAPLQMDLVLNAAIPELEFERERQVVLEEIRRSQDNIRRCVFARAMALTFDRLPYRRPVLGPAEVIATLTAEQMRQFHRQWYAPSNLTAVVVGNLPVEVMVETLEQQLSSHRTPAVKPVPAPLLPEPILTETQHQEVRDDRLTEARLMLLWRVPGLEDRWQTYALDVLARILGAGRTSRLVKDLRETRGLVTHISVSNLTHVAQGIFWVSAHLPVENIDVTKAAILEHIRQIREDCVTAAELTRVQRQTVNSFIFENETPSSRAGLYGYAQAIAGDLATGLNYASCIQAVDRVAVQNAAQTFLSLEGYRTLVMYP
ncbi:M16 family metallopeptidase [Altericista sp. CCNU0014]|uniref:M16 family metallopeptidase n=1 Tax=Altericista sp. CCNU0014 TaxID=3082949 RepID=UPI0038516B5E